MVDSLYRALSALAEAHPHLDAWELADALWLAASSGDELSTESHGGPSRTQQARTGTSNWTALWGTPGQDSLTAGQVHERLATSTSMAPGREVTVAPAHSPASSLAMARAFQPFTRPWRRGARNRLDVELTVDAYAESGILIPVMTPEPERWFDLVVIVDTTPSMAVWHADIISFTSLLNGMGTFRHTYRWQLDPTTATITDSRRIPVPASAQTGLANGARRLVLLISDFASPSWDDGPPWELVHSLASAAPTALVDPLPARLWAHSGLDHPMAPVHAKHPGVSSRSLTFRLPLWLQTIAPEAEWLPVPVTGLDAPELGQWARTLMRADPEGTNAVLLNLAWLLSPPVDDHDERPLAESVDAFLHTASPEAARIAVLCSPIERFSLPLLHLIRHTSVPRANLSDLAELLVSGLVETEYPESGNPILSFRSGVAAQLRTHLTYHDAWHTFDAISRHVAVGSTDARDKNIGPLAASVIDPASDTLVPIETQAFAAAATDIERALVPGGPADSRLPVIDPGDGPGSPSRRADHADPGTTPRPRGEEAAQDSRADLTPAEAVRRYRSLAQADPGTYLPVLAASLTRLSSHLTAHGQPEAGIEAAHEAVRLYRRLVDRYSDRYRPHLASSLNDLNALRQYHSDEFGSQYTTICAIDIAGYGAVSRTRTNYIALREGMYQVVEQAFTQSGISWADCYQQDAGDGILTLAPAGVGKGLFAGKLPEALVSELRVHNTTHPPEEQIRVRMVLHAGEVTRDVRGVTGPAIIHAFRLLDSPPLKEALNESSGVLAVIASDWFYSEIIRHSPVCAPEEYERVVVDLKRTRATGWIRLPDAPARRPVIAAEAVSLDRDVSHDETAIVGPVARPASPEFYQIVDALETIPCMRDDHPRALVIEQLSFGSTIPFFASRRAHVTAILRTCLDFEDGVVQLVAAISNQEPSESIPLNRLVALLTRSS